MRSLSGQSMVSTGNLRRRLPPWPNSCRRPQWMRLRTDAALGRRIRIQVDIWPRSPRWPPRPPRRWSLSPSRESLSFSSWPDTERGALGRPSGKFGNGSQSVRGLVSSDDCSATVGWTGLRPSPTLRPPSSARNPRPSSAGSSSSDDCSATAGAGRASTRPILLTALPARGKESEIRRRQAVHCRCLDRPQRYRQAEGQRPERFSPRRRPRVPVAADGSSTRLTARAWAVRVWRR